MLLPALPWPISFLQLNDYLNCPRKAYYKHVAKVTEYKSSQQREGINAHDALKRYLKFNEPLPSELQAYETAVLPLARLDAAKHVEIALGATHKGEACGFFDEACGLRARLDFAAVKQHVIGDEQHLSAFIVDWKTGKAWEDPLELKIQALMLRIHNPQIKLITGGYYWLRENRMGRLYDLSKFLETWESVCRWAAGIRNAIDTNNWQPDENPLCSWCPVTKQQCEFKKEKR